MIIELNINLNVIGRRNSLHDCDVRRNLSRDTLRRAFSSVNFERYQAQEEGNDGMLHDVDVLIARIHTDGPTTARARKVVETLARDIEQHCIAMYFPHGDNLTSTPYGLIVGPHATGWPAFDLAEFYRWKLTYSNLGKLRINNSSNKFANAH
jgi:hypothetical protein